MVKVVTSIAIYAAPISATSMNKKTYRAEIEAAYRRSAGMMTLKLVVDLKRRKHDTSRGINLPNPVQLVDNAMDRWQQDWSDSTKEDGTTDSYRE